VLRGLTRLLSLFFSLHTANQTQTGVCVCVCALVDLMGGNAVQSDLRFMFILCRTAPKGLHPLVHEINRETLRFERNDKLSFRSLQVVKKRKRQTFIMQVCLYEFSVSNRA